MSVSDGLPVVRALAELAGLAERHERLYVRWSRGPEIDLTRASSTDGLTGPSLPGLSANPLDVEDGWQGRPVQLWVARRLYDYSHLPYAGAGGRTTNRSSRTCARCAGSIPG
jgi:hypothetical protein